MTGTVWAMPPYYVTGVWMADPAMQEATADMVRVLITEGAAAEGQMPVGPLRRRVEPVWQVPAGVDVALVSEGQARLHLLGEASGPLPSPALYLVRYEADTVTTASAWAPTPGRLRGSCTVCGHGWKVHEPDPTGRLTPCGHCDGGQEAFSPPPAGTPGGVTLSSLAAAQRAQDELPCSTCGGDRLRVDFTGSGRCHAPRG